MVAQEKSLRPTSSSGLEAELAGALKRRRVMLLSLAAQSEQELVALAGPSGRASAADLAPLVGRLDERARHELEAIDEALARMALGSYGRCETCGRSIETPRLLAVPTARSCAACAAVLARPGDEPGCELPAHPLPADDPGNAPRQRQRPRY